MVASHLNIGRPSISAAIGDEDTEDISQSSTVFGASVEHPRRRLEADVDLCGAVVGAILEHPNCGATVDRDVPHQSTDSDPRGDSQ
jgi:hypothetical protein